MSAPTTVIRSNGGGTMLPIDALFTRLETDVLDPTFEEYGNFIEQMEGGGVSFFGNFHTYSHVFNIETHDAALIERLSALILANQATDAYAAAKVEYAEEKRRHREWVAERDRKRREDQQEHARRVLAAE